MDNFAKIELIINGRLKERKVKLDRIKKNELNAFAPSSLYILGIQHEVQMLERILNDIDAIKGDQQTVSDEMVVRVYGLEK